MNGRPLHKIVSVEAKPGYRLVVLLEGFASPIVVDMSETISRGGVFSSLQDEAVFGRVRVGERRRVIEWPQPFDYNGEPIIDIDAESLLIMTNQQRSRSLFERLIDIFRHQGTRVPS